LMLMLAVMLPAAALIVVSAHHLRTIQRDKAIEAAIQRDYQQVLAIAEKRINERAYDTAENDTEKFPDVENTDKIDSFLNAHPNVDHAFLWTGKGNFLLRSQPSRMQDLQFCSDSRTVSSHIGGWMDIEGKMIISRLNKIAVKEGRHVYFDMDWVTQGDKMLYRSLVFFIPRGSSPEHPALAGLIYDPDYLKSTFFPQALNDVVPRENRGDTSHPQTAIMVRTEKDQSPLAASDFWEGGSPEVERPFEDVFPGLILGIKLRGTTIAGISDRFFADYFLILGALSLLMGAGMIFTYRNVTRELALAKVKSDFVSNVSHELRTPLALIRLYAETLELGRISSSGKQQEYYEIIRKESERLTSLINNILDFSRIESGQKRVQLPRDQCG